MLRGNLKPIAVCIGLGVLAVISFAFKSDFFVLAGEVDETMERKAEWLTRLPFPIVVDSFGGSSASALNISKLIYNRKKSIYIRADCSSACAEYFMPAAKKVYASRNAIIGYHMSNFWDEIYFQNAADLSDSCSANKLIWLKKLYSERGLNPHFYKETAQRLQAEALYGRNFQKNPNCVTAVFAIHRAEIWYPSAQQLKDKLKLKIGHPICVDDAKCRQSLISDMPYAEPRTSGQAKVMIDTLYPMPPHPYRR